MRDEPGALRGTVQATARPGGCQRRRSVSLLGFPPNGCGGSNVRGKRACRCHAAQRSLVDTWGRRAVGAHSPSHAPSGTCTECAWDH